MVVSGGDRALDSLALVGDCGIEVARSVHAGALRDDGPGADRLGMVEEGVSVVSSVGDELGGTQTGDRRQGVGRIIGLALVSSKRMAGRGIDSHTICWSRLHGNAPEPDRAPRFAGGGLGVGVMTRSVSQSGQLRMAINGPPKAGVPLLNVRRAVWKFH